MSWLDTRTEVIEKWRKRFKAFFSVTNLWLWLLVFFFCVGIILTLPWVFTHWQSVLDFTATGQIGDTIGGLTAPFVAILAALLTFIAFWVQYRANEDQKDQLNRQSFESIFFEMIRLHTENVVNTKIS